MAWSTPPTFVSGNVLTAAQMNVLTSDLLESIPAKATQGLTLDPPYAGGTVYSPGFYSATGANALAEMHVGSLTLLTDKETTTSTSFADLPTVGPSVQVTCNSLAIVFVNVAIISDIASAATGIQISGATTLAAGNTGPSVNTPNAQETTCAMRSFAVNSGVNLFTLQYAVSAGTTGTYWRRHMTVWPF